MSNPNPTSKVAWIETPLREIMDYFIKGAKVQEGDITSYEFFVDQRKGQVAFKLVIEPKEESRIHRLS